MTVYCFDTSAFIETWTRDYPPDVFPGVWDGIGDLIRNGKLISPDMVRRELREKSDLVSEWTEQFANLFVDPDVEQIEQVRMIVNRFPRIIEERRARNEADPFVIGLAYLRGLVCVTEESTGNDTNIRIPYVCKRLGVDCVDTLALMRREGWQFTR